MVLMIKSLENNCAKRFFYESETSKMKLEKIITTKNSITLKF